MCVRAKCSRVLAFSARNLCSVCLRRCVRWHDGDGKSDDELPAPTLPLIITIIMGRCSGALGARHLMNQIWFGPGVIDEAGLGVRVSVGLSRSNSTPRHDTPSAAAYRQAYRLAVILYDFVIIARTATHRLRCALACLTCMCRVSRRRAVSAANERASAI